MDERFTITATTKDGKPHGLPSSYLRDIKEAVMGKSYTLSLAFVGERRAQALNVAYRHKNTVPNVLSFPLSKTEGEIIICTKKAGRDAKHFGMTPRIFIAYLFIHGLLHLKGYSHGSKMDTAERKLTERFKLVG